MSDYLIDELEDMPNIRICLRTEVVGGSGEARQAGPMLLEASLPGVFAAGDVRNGSSSGR